MKKPTHNMPQLLSTPHLALLLSRSSRNFKTLLTLCTRVTPQSFARSTSASPHSTTVADQPDVPGFRVGDLVVGFRVGDLVVGDLEVGCATVGLVGILVGERVVGLIVGTRDGGAVGTFANKDMMASSLASSLALNASTFWLSVSGSTSSLAVGTLKKFPYGPSTCPPPYPIMLLNTMPMSALDPRSADAPGTW